MIYIYNPSLSDLEIQNFKGGTYRFGPEIWTLTTFQYSKEYYSEIVLVNKLPESGIVMSHNDYLEKIKPNRNQYFVSLQADRKMSKNAHCVIIQNKDQFWQKFLFYKTYFVKHWPEKDVIKRDRNRKGLKTIKYVGNPANLDKYFMSTDWLNFCNENNIVWEVINERNKWSDFTDIDLLIAVRSFGKTKIKQKPATKLYNAWLANVPIIVGSNETAYFHERKSEYDFIDVDSIDTIKYKIVELIGNNKKYETFIVQSETNECNANLDSIVKDWINIFTSIEQDSINYFNSNWIRLKTLTINKLKQIIL